MKEITFNENEKALEALQSGYNNMWDVFFHGDPKSGTKPGNINVYGKIAGIREVAEKRMNYRDHILSGGEKER